MNFNKNKNMKKNILIIASVNVLIFSTCLVWKAQILSNELAATKAELAIRYYFFVHFYYIDIVCFFWSHFLIFV